MEHEDFARTGAYAASLSRRRFLLGTGALAGAALLPLGAAPVAAEPHDDQAQWVANHIATRLVAADGTPTAYLPRWSRLRVLRGLPRGWLEVWAPRLSLVGRVQVSAIGPVAAPSSADLARERAEAAAPPQLGAIGLPARVSGGANLRLWPSTSGDTLLRSLPHNASLRALTSVQGDDGDEWYHVSLLDAPTNQPVGEGYIHSSLVRLPRLQGGPSADRLDRPSRWFEADLKEPAMLVAMEDAAPIWASLTLKGTIVDRTPLGVHRIVRRVANETMNSETLYPKPIPRNAPGGYYLKDVLWTQYFSWLGESIHYNYWSSNFGYAGSRGCLGLPYNEAKFAWEFGDVGTQVRIFA